MNDLMADLAAILAMTQPFMIVATLVFIRVGAVVALLPGAGEHSVPQRVKLAFVLALTAVVAPLAADGPLLGIQTLGVANIGTEVVAGLLIGAGLRILVLALQTAGSIIAQATTLSQLFAGAAPEPQPAISNLFIMAGLALAVNAGLHVQAAELVLRSYAMLPLGHLPSAVDIADWGLYQVVSGFGLAFVLAAPFVIASMIYNLALGAINRAMPQLMVSFVGAPALTLGALVMLAVATPVLLTVWLEAVSNHLSQPFTMPP